MSLNWGIKDRLVNYRSDSSVAHKLPALTRKLLDLCLVHWKGAGGLYWLPPGWKAGTQTFRVEDFCYTLLEPV